MRFACHATTLQRVQALTTVRQVGDGDRSSHEVWPRHPWEDLHDVLTCIFGLSIVELPPDLSKTCQSLFVEVVLKSANAPVDIASRNLSGTKVVVTSKNSGILLDRSRGTVNTCSWGARGVEHEKRRIFKAKINNQQMLR